MAVSGFLPKGTRRERMTSCSLVLAGAALMVWRAPTYFLEPGFWAEDGTLHFAHAWSSGWRDTLLSAPQGYLVLWTALSAALATRLVSLVQAPLVTTLMAFIVQLVPLAIIAFGTAEEWRGLRRKMLGMAIVSFASINGEIWLNTTNAGFWFSLIAVLILLESPEVSRVRGTLYTLLLVLAGLTGPVSCFLVPLFVAKAFGGRQRIAIVQAVVLAACAAIQAGELISSIVVDSPAAPERFLGLSLPVVAFVVWMRTLVLPVFGIDAAQRFALGLSWWTKGDLTSVAARWIGLAVVVLAFQAVAWLAWRLPRRQQIALAGSYWLISLGSIVGSIGDKSMLLRSAAASSRYFYVPGVIVLLLCFCNAYDAEATPARRVVCAALLATGIGVGVAHYREAINWRSTWPRWRNEVTEWEANPTHELAIWPPPWKMQLPRAARP